MGHKISVALCTYNGEKFLAKQLDSIFSQTLPVQEIIVCDDGSKDKTKNIISEYDFRYPGIIKLFSNEKNLRSVKNFEKAISLTTGDFIFLSDQDDLWHPQKTERIIRHFNDNPTAELVFTDAWLIDDNDERIGSYALWQTCIFSPEMLGQCGNFWKLYQYYDNMVTGATICIKKVMKDFIFPFPVSKDFHHDEWMALHAAQKNSLYLLDEKLTFYRIHQNQQVGGGLIERYEREKLYAETILDLKKPKTFSLYFKVFKRVYALYKKHYDLKQVKESHTIDIEGLVNGDAASLRKTGREMRMRFPLMYTGKRIHDYLRGKRQIKK